MHRLFHTTELSKILRFFSLLSVIVLSIFFGACSTKKVYEPKVITGDWKSNTTNDQAVIDITADISLLENRTVMSKSAVIDVKIEEGFRLLSSSDGWIISSNIEGNVTLDYIDDKSMRESFELKKTVAAASVKNDILAILFADNEMALYAISSKELILREKGNAQKVVDSRVVNPYFMNDLVLFSTLDGKIIIINIEMKKKLRTVIVSSEDNFNNIIYFNIIDEKIIAATGYKILSMSQKDTRVKYELRNVVDVDGTVFISTKQGEVISLTSDLEVNAKAKFAFAHFLGMIAYKDKIYLLEKEGYLIELSKDLLEYKVYEVDIEDGYVFVADKRFYIADEYISVE